MNYKKMIIEAIERVKDEKILKKIYYLRPFQVLCKHKKLT